MKRNLVLILVLCLALGLVIGGCGSKAEDGGKNASPVKTDSSWTDIKEKGYFIIGLDDAFPPMGFRDEKNNIVGFDIDLAKEAANVWEWKLSFSLLYGKPKLKN